jgi:hypothetical protein
MYENRFLYEKIWGELEILLAYNRLIHHSNVNDKNVHPLISPKIRMAKVRNDEKLKKQILDQTPCCGKRKPPSCQKR